MSTVFRDFRVAVPDEELSDLKERLARTRFPEQETVGDWSQGVPLAYVKELCEYWRDDYDWQRTEAKLNAHPQFLTEIDGLDIHFLHVRSPHPDAMPLILTTGWPGSLLEYLEAIGPLTDPEAHGGSAADAFHIVCPSLPGYGWSGKPTATGWDVERVARAWAELMARLGYERYGAQGSDWGTSVSTSIGQQDAEHVAGLHMVPPLVGPDPETLDELTSPEQEAIDCLAAHQREDGAYAVEHSTRPQTIGYALVDSPAALCAWIVEKFWAWTDCEGHPENAISRDEILDDVTLYWLSASGASSARLYWESFKQVEKWLSGTSGDTVEVPTGCSIFPHENNRASRRWAAKRYTDIRYWSEPKVGGHFAALEHPGLFVDEVRACFRTMR